MAEGNGVDLGSIYQLLAIVARDVGDLKIGLAKLDRRVADLERGQVKLERGLAELTQTVAHYHGSVLGHGVLITELDERLRRVEHHLNLPSHS